MGQNDSPDDDKRGAVLLPERTGQTGSLELSAAERSIIHRQRNDINQSEAAKRFNVSRRRFGEMEQRGEVDWETDIEPAPHEICMVKRCRAGLTQSELAEQIGVTRYWLSLMECGKATSTKLEAYWDGR